MEVAEVLVSVLLGVRQAFFLCVVETMIFQLETTLWRDLKALSRIRDPEVTGSVLIHRANSKLSPLRGGGQWFFKEPVKVVSVVAAYSRLRSSKPQVTGSISENTVNPGRSLPLWRGWELETVQRFSIVSASAVESWPRIDEPYIIPVQLPALVFGGGFDHFQSLEHLAIKSTDSTFGCNVHISGSVFLDVSHLRASEPFSLGVLGESLLVVAVDAASIAPEPVAPAAVLVNPPDAGVDLDRVLTVYCYWEIRPSQQQKEKESLGVKELSIEREMADLSKPSDGHREDLIP